MKKVITSFVIVSVMVLTIVANVPNSSVSSKLNADQMASIHGEKLTFGCIIAIIGAGVGVAAFIAFVTGSGGSAAGASYSVSTAIVGLLEGACAKAR